MLQDAPDGLEERDGEDDGSQDGVRVVVEFSVCDGYYDAEGEAGD